MIKNGKPTILIVRFSTKILILQDTLPVAVNTIACTPDDGCKRTRNILSKIALK
jgi:hypothetical protein